jgi:TPR repeat protein
MSPHSKLPAEYKSSSHRLRFWAALLSTVLVLGWIQSSSLLRRQHKLIRLSPRHFQTGSASLAELKSRSAIVKRQEPTPHALPAEDPRLLAALSGRPDAQYDLGVAYARGQGVQSDYTVASTWLILAMSVRRN